jgi:hypothetical protein
MKRLVLILVLQLIICGAFAITWEWEQTLGLPATAFAGENAIQAVGDTLYTAYIVQTPPMYEYGLLYFSKSSTDFTSNINLSSQGIPATGKPTLVVDLPNISILVNSDIGLFKLSSSDYGITWEFNQLINNMLHSNDPYPILTQGGGSVRSFTVNSMTDTTDVMYYTQQSSDVRGKPVYFWGQDIVYGAIKTAGDIYLRQVGGGTNNGWPTFLGPVIISGNVVSTPAFYPVDQVFQGGLVENAEMDATVIRSGLYKQDFIDNATIMESPYGLESILLLEVEGNTASGYWGLVGEPRRAFADVWNPYPPLPVADADSLFRNTFTIRDTLWTEIAPFELPDKLFTDATLWIEGTFSGVKSIYSSEIIYTIGDILLQGTAPGEDPSANPSDKVTLISDKKILLKYGYKHPGDSLRYHPNCGPDSEPILIYADLIALKTDFLPSEDQPDFDAGEFSFEYQHPHPSTPAVNLIYYDEELYYDWIDIHRRRYPPTSSQPWPANIDYPWYNPLWPERQPYTERGVVKSYGAIYQNRRGLMHRSGNDSEYPSNSGVWNIPYDMCGGPVTLTPIPDPVINNLILQNRKYPGTSGSGVGYKRYHIADTRDFPGLPRKEIWSLGALIAEHQYGSEQIVKWHKRNEQVVHKSIDYYDGEWLYQLNNTLLTDDMAYPHDPGEGWEIVQAKLLYGGGVLTLQKSTVESAPGYRLVISTLEGEQASNNFITESPHEFIALSRIADGFLLPIPNSDGNLTVLRFNESGYVTEETSTIELPDGALGEDITDSRVTFINPSGSILHACLWFRSSNQSSAILHKYGSIDPVALDDPSVAPILAKVKCYPNPFARQINIEVESNKAIRSQIGIYNIRGQKVRDLPMDLSKGTETFVWDGCNKKGQSVAKGIYFVKVKGLPDSKTQRILKLD